MILPANIPPTIIVVHRAEKRSKCSVEPLRKTGQFVFWRYPKRGAESLEGYVRLGLGGPQLSAEDHDRGLVLLDGSWRWAAKMEKSYADVSVRGLGPWVTAYPRQSRVFEDPAEGLATIEALFAALCQMGRPVQGLLDSYHWGELFLQRNRGLIEHFVRTQCRDAASDLKVH
jgi:pre-rRNA-processing protein TSR3